MGYDLKRIAAMGVDRALYDIMSPAVERSVLISCYTTTEVVLKVSSIYCQIVPWAMSCVTGLAAEVIARGPACHAVEVELVISHLKGPPAMQGCCQA